MFSVAGGRMCPNYQELSEISPMSRIQGPD